LPFSNHYFYSIHTIHTHLEDTIWYFNSCLQCVMIRLGHSAYLSLQTFISCLCWEHFKSIPLAILKYAINYCQLLPPYCSIEHQNLLLLSNCSFIPNNQPLFIPPLPYLLVIPILLSTLISVILSCHVCGNIYASHRKALITIFVGDDMEFCSTPVPYLSNEDNNSVGGNKMGRYMLSA
jgi:hypothetical protein